MLRCKALPAGHLGISGLLAWLAQEKNKLVEELLTVPVESIKEAISRDRDAPKEVRSLCLCFALVQQL